MKAKLIAATENVRALLSDVSKWNQSHYARTADGEQIDQPLNPRACAWCLRGAYVLQFRTHMCEEMDEIYSAFRMANPGIPEIASARSLVNFNDRATHEEVLRALDRTLEYLKSAA